LIDYYFTKIYSNQIKISNKSIQAKNIIGLHDMFIIYQITQPTSSSSTEFFELCKKKLQENQEDLIVKNYNNYLNRCGLKDIIDLFLECKLKSLIKTIDLTVNNINDEIDRLVLDCLLEMSLERFIYDEKTQINIAETSQNILKLIDNEKKSIEQTISKVSCGHHCRR
jgi:hypothetical protein